MTTTAPSTHLNHTEQRVAVHLVQGVHPAHIGRQAQAELLTSTLARTLLEVL